MCGSDDHNHARCLKDKTPGQTPCRVSASSHQDHSLSRKLTMSDKTNEKSIEIEAQKHFASIDKDGNGYLTRAELQQAKELSDNANTRLVAEALSESFDWIKKRSNDQTLSETQLSWQDITSLELYADKNDNVSKVMSNFARLDLNGDGYYSGQEYLRVDKSTEHEDLKELNREFFSNDRPHRLVNLSCGCSACVGSRRKWGWNRMDWVATESNDQWGSDRKDGLPSVSMADLRVLKAGTDQVRKMNAILQKVNSR
jgi:Ca2+-binding EF-hand superfamily protein